MLKAAREGHREISELLINNGADLKAKNIDGNPPLDYAIENNHTEISVLLGKHGGKTGKELEAKGNKDQDGQVRSPKKHNRVKVHKNVRN